MTTTDRTTERIGIPIFEHLEAKEGQDGHMNGIGIEHVCRRPQQERWVWSPIYGDVLMPPARLMCETINAGGYCPSFELREDIAFLEELHAIGAEEPA
jgi:hypothetical protein